MSFNMTRQEGKNNEQDFYSLTSQNIIKHYIV